MFDTFLNGAKYIFLRCRKLKSHRSYTEDTTLLLFVEVTIVMKLYASFMNSKLEVGCEVAFGPGGAKVVRSGKHARARGKAAFAELRSAVTTALTCVRRMYVA